MYISVPKSLRIERFTAKNSSSNRATIVCLTATASVFGQEINDGIPSEAVYIKKAFFKIRLSGE